MKHLQLLSALLLHVLATGDCGERFRVGGQIMTRGAPASSRPAGAVREPGSGVP